MTPAYQVDGVDLHVPSAGREVLASSQVSTGLTVAAADLTIPGVAGSVPSPRGPQSAPTLTLNLAVTGADEDTMQANLHTLARLLYTGSTITRTVGSTVTSAPMELQTLSQPVFFQSLLRYEMTAVIKLPTVYWRGSSATWTKSAPTTDTAYEVTTLGNTSGPVVDALILVTGPVSGPTIHCLGEWLNLNTSLTASEKALIDCAAWTVRKGTGVTFAGGGSLVSGALTNSGSRYLLRLVPRMRSTDPANTRVQVAISSTGMSSNTKLQIQAAPAYLV